MADSSITVSGSVGAEPDLRFSSNGKAVVGFSLAANYRYMRDGEWIDGEVTWWRCSVFGELAENVAASLHKGDRAIVTGRPQARSWQDRDGNDRTSIEIMVDDIGASLKWARAEIERVERSDGRSSSRGAPRGSGGGRGRSAPRRSEDPLYGSDEPFTDLGASNIRNLYLEV